jgi:hypothetical protein
MVPTNYEQSLRRVIWYEIYALAAATGVLQASPRLSALLLVVMQVALQAALVGWCVVDARLRGRPLLPVVQMMMFFTAHVAAPIYLIWSRRFRGAALALLNLVGLFATFLFFYGLAESLRLAAL